MAKVIPKKSRLKIQLVLVSVVAIAAVYSYFAYSKDLFPFTKEFKAKLNKLFKGKTPLDEEALEDILGEGLVDEFGNIRQPGGGTGALDPSGASGLGEAMIKGDPEMAAQYQQGLYKQLFLPFENAPGRGGSGSEGDDPHSAIIRGGDIPSQSQMGNIPQPYKYPFPVDERLYDMYGLFPPGGSYGGRSPTSPFYPSDKPKFNPAILNCNDCPPGQSWDNCGCRCADEDAPRLMCFRPECECPDEGRGYGGGGGKRKRRWPRYRGDEEYEEEEDEGPIPEIPDIPDWLPDDVLAEIGDLRDLRDKLLQEIDALEDELQAEIDELSDKIEEEKEKREELEDVVEEIQEEMAETPPDEQHEHKKEWTKTIAVATAGHDGVKAEIKQITSDAKNTHSQLEATTSQAKAVTSQIKAVASAGGATATAGGSSSGSSKRKRSSSSSGTKATAGGGKAVACAGGKCISAGQALHVGYLNRAERNFAFSKLQNKAMRMNNRNVKPTTHLKARQFLNVLPPIVQRRHFASRMTIS